MRRSHFMMLPALLALAALIQPQLAPQVLAQTKKPASTEQPPPLKLKVGDMVPDFTLPDQNGKEVSLKDFRGKKSVALAFYVFAFTGG